MAVTSGLPGVTKACLDQNQAIGNHGQWWAGCFGYRRCWDPNLSPLNGRYSEQCPWRINLCLLFQVHLNFLGLTMHKIFTKSLDFYKHAVISPFSEELTKIMTHVQKKKPLKAKIPSTTFPFWFLFTAKLKGIVYTCCSPLLPFSQKPTLIRSFVSLSLLNLSCYY